MFAVAIGFFWHKFEFGTSFAIMFTGVINISHTRYAEYTQILLDVIKPGLTCLLRVECTYGNYPPSNSI